MGFLVRGNVAKFYDRITWEQECICIKQKECDVNKSSTVYNSWEHENKLICKFLNELLQLHNINVI